MRSERLSINHILLMVIAVSCLLHYSSVVEAKKLPQGEVRVYKKTPTLDLRMWVYKPVGWKASDHRPVVILMHGGGWFMRNLTQLEPQAKIFAEYGVVAIIADYRSTNKDRVKVGALLSDARSAVRYVRKHAKDLGIDPNRVIGAGASSGGHLMSSAAIITDPAFDDPQDDKSISPAPNIFIGFNPVMSRKEKQWSQAVHVKKDSIPVVMCYAKDDTAWVPTAYAYEKAAKAKGATVELQLYEKGGHGFFRHGDMPRKTLESMLPFLYRHGAMDFILNGVAGKQISLASLEQSLPGYSWTVDSGGEIKGQVFHSDGTVGLIPLIGKKQGEQEVTALISVGVMMDDHSQEAKKTGNPESHKLTGTYKKQPDATIQIGEGVTILKSKGQSLTYSFDDLPAGEYVIDVHIPFYWSASKAVPIQVTVGDQTQNLSVKYGNTPPQWKGIHRVIVKNGESLRITLKSDHSGKRGKVVPVDAVRVMPCYTGNAKQ